jgi:DNA-binding CsgD family transcriptional regulator/predicted ABC-type transport system involved in lysophospholipase L1 biosynthesis ATPase subunit
MTNAPMIDLREATKKYDDGPPALAGVTLSVAFGECVAILGHSGSSKSTLLNLIVASSLESLHGAAVWPEGGELLSAAVEAALATGHKGTARDLIGQAEQGSQSADAPATTANLHLARGALLLDDGDEDSAAEQFGRARAMFEIIGRPYRAAHAVEQAASAHLPGRPRLAAEQLRLATDMYLGLGAAADAARCQKVQRELGVRQPRPRGRRSYGSQLSPREEQVASLLRDAATNQDIAHALALSPRTVEHHVASVLKKLGTTREGMQNSG